MGLFPQPTFKWTAQSANYTALDGDCVLVTTGSSTITITLPPVNVNQNGTVSARKVDSGSGAFKFVTADGSTIDGVAGATGITSAASIHAGYTVADDGANWWVVGQ